MIDVAVLSSPRSLFPVDLYRKFSFNPPVGVFFDLSGGYVVENALGDSAFRAYRGHFENLDPPAGQIVWYNGHPDLKDEEVLATWDEEPPKEDSDRSLEDKITFRACLMKAKLRAMLWGISYQRNTFEMPKMPDITELVRNLEEAFPKVAKGHQ